MIIVLGLVVLVVALLGAGALGSGLLGGTGRGGAAAVVVPVVVTVVAVLGVVVLAGLVVGIGGGVDGGGDAGSGDQETEASPTTEAASLLPSRTTGVTTTIPSVNLEIPDDDQFAPYLPLGGLRAGGVVHVRAAGFRWHETGRIEQCVTELGRMPACTDPFPVQFDEDGRAEFQLAVSGDFAPGGCRAGQPACSLRLTGSDERRQATQQYVLVDEIKPGQVTVTPSSGLAPGETVVVTVAGFPAGGRATAVLCAPPGPYDARRCSDAAADASFAVDARGSGQGALTVPSGGTACGPRRPCGVVVIVADGYLAAAPARVGLASGPGVGYDAGRVVPGVLIAVALVALAAGLAVKTDWTKPTEAATPELDAADLRTDRSLDDLFGADDELEARDPIPW